MHNLQCYAWPKKCEDMKRDVKCSCETTKKKTGLTTALLRVPRGGTTPGLSPRLLPLWP